jgi:hypothetical protein
MDYPQLHIPGSIIKIIETKEYQKPLEPTKPIQASQNSNFFPKLISIIFGFGLVLLQVYVFGLIIMGMSLIWIITNPENKTKILHEKKYLNALTTYNSKYQQFKVDLKKYTEMTISEYSKYMGNKAILNTFQFSTQYSIHSDYKKGASHQFFKTFLSQSFKEKIFEDAAIKITDYRSSYYDSDYKPYITDFLYYDSKTNMHVAIEIDEPYNLKDKKPIHINDSDRNSFFLKHNWIIIRFAEEQIVLQPFKCCEYIKQIIYALQNDYTIINSIPSGLQSVKKWTLEDINELIITDYRNSYLRKLSDSQYINQIHQLNKMFNFDIIPAFNDRPDFII